MSPVEVRHVQVEEADAFSRSVTRWLGFPPASEEWLELMRRDWKPERSLGAYDGDQLVGTAGSHLFELTVPGPAIVAAAGVTRVSVAATHRRRGILRELMRRQLSEARERGEPVAILMASESVIYGRFGYGLASNLFDIEIDPRSGTFAAPAPSGTLAVVDEATADKMFPVIFDRARRVQPGAINRAEGWWDVWRADRKPHTETLVLYESPTGDADGYVRYKLDAGWDAGLPSHRLEVRDLIGVTPGATAALWQHCLNVDLARTLVAYNRPVDEPLRWLLADPRRMRITRFGDFLWARLLDVGQALGARAYAEGSVVLEVADEMFPGNDGRYEVGPEGCERTERAADLRLPVAELGAVYMGGNTFSELAAVGRIEELRAGALATADATFASRPKPWCHTSF